MIQDSASRWLQQTAGGENLYNAIWFPLKALSAEERFSRRPSPKWRLAGPIRWNLSDTWRAVMDHAALRQSISRMV